MIACVDERRVHLCLRLMFTLHLFDVRHETHSGTIVTDFNNAVYWGDLSFDQ